MQTVYLFTSTAQPYIKDALDLLALPSNISYRFRYDVKWLPTDLFVDETKTKLKPLDVKDALLIHVHTEPSSTEIPKIAEFIPIRKAKVIETRLMGDFVWIHFTLGDWVVYDNPRKTATQNQHHDIIRNLMPQDSKDDYKYTAVISNRHNISTLQDDLQDDKDEVLSNWSNIISYLKTIPPHGKSVFLKLLKILDINDNKKLVPEKLDDRYGFALESGKTYRIEVLQRYFGKIDTPINLELVTDSNEIVKIKEDQIQGKYDVLLFTITSEKTARTRRSFLIFKPQQSDLIIPQAFYDLKILPHKPTVSVIIALLAVGFTLTGSSEFLKDYLNQFAAFLPPIGGFLIAIGSYMIPKKW